MSLVPFTVLHPEQASMVLTVTQVFEFTPQESFSLHLSVYVGNHHEEFVFMDAWDRSIAIKFPWRTLDPSTLAMVATT